MTINNRIITRYYFGSINTLWYTSIRIYLIFFEGYGLEPLVSRCHIYLKWNKLIQNSFPNYIMVWKQCIYYKVKPRLRWSLPFAGLAPWSLFHRASSKDGLTHQSLWCLACGPGVGTLRVPGRNLPKKFKNCKDIRIAVYPNVWVEPK